MLLLLKMISPVEQGKWVTEPRSSKLIVVLLFIVESQSAVFF